MMQKHFALLFIVAALLSGCAGEGKLASFPQGEQTVPNPAYHLSAEAIPELESKALLGDGDAALSLCLYNGYYLMSERDGMYWLHIAAEDGNKSAEHQLGELMRGDNNDPKHYTRSHFWLDKAGS